jgi:hypothetical protein
VVPIHRKGVEFIIDSLKTKLTSTLVLLLVLLYAISLRRQNVVAELREGFPVSLVRKLKEKVKGVLSDRFVWLRVQGQGEGVHCNLGKTWRDLLKK